jgi:hypothetical protein
MEWGGVVGEWESKREIDRSDRNPSLLCIIGSPNRRSRRASSYKGILLWTDHIDCKAGTGISLSADRNDCRLCMLHTPDHHRGILGARKRQQMRE